MAIIKNPLTIVKVTGGGSEPGGEARITGYDTSTGVITGEAFGATTGTVYMLDRDTHTYVSQPVSSWSSSSITLTTPIDLSTLEGDTSIVVVTNSGEWSTKWLITGQVAVTGWGKLYIKDADTGVVRTVTVSNSTEFGLLNTGSNGFSKQITIGGDTFYGDEIVGFQFGSSYGGTFPQRILAYCENLNQPITVPGNGSTIGNYFLYSCYSFNQPITLSSGIASIGTNFLGNCYSFNQSVTLPSTITQISNSFMSGCRVFNQAIKLPTNLAGIGNSFFENLYSFNQPVTLPSTVTSLGTPFMANCYSFNQPFSFPSTFTSIPSGFLNNCTKFNSPITLPTSLTSIPTNFLTSSSSYNQPINIPSTVTAIGSGFLQGCYSFNQPLTLPSNLASIGDTFLYGCASFNQHLTLPSTLTSFGINFLNGCYAFSHLTTNTTSSPTDNNALSCSYSTAKMYVKGVTVDGSGASAWITNLPDRAANPYRKLINGNA